MYKAVVISKLADVKAEKQKKMHIIFTLPKFAFMLWFTFIKE